MPNHSIAIQTRNGFASEGEFRYVEHALDRIRRRAYDRAAANGFPGTSLDDWLAAEHELFAAPPCELTETDAAYLVRMAAPGFAANQLSVAVEPRAVAVHGLAETGVPPDPAAKTIWSEFSSREVFRRFVFERDINMDAVKASLDQGMLTVHLPKAPVALLPAAAMAAAA